MSDLNEYSIFKEDGKEVKKDEEKFTNDVHTPQESEAFKNFAKKFGKKKENIPMQKKKENPPNDSAYVQKKPLRSKEDIKKYKIANYIKKNIKIISPSSIFENVHVYHNYWEENNYKFIKNHPDQVDIHYIISHLTHTKSEGFSDFLVDLISSKYINETFFYISQLISLLYYKSINYKSSSSIETFLLDRCVNQIKYSVLITWIVNASTEDAEMLSESPEYAQYKVNPYNSPYSALFKNMDQQIDFYEDLGNKIETTLVNGMRCTLGNRLLFNLKKKIANTEIYKLAQIKGPRLNYYNEIINFYADLKALCEKLKEYPKDSPDKKKTRNYILRQELGQRNEKIKQFFENSFKETKDMDNDLQDLFRGILLPFDDTTRVDDNFNNIIVNILPEYSMCFSTKARVPIKIVVECITVFECKKWSQLYREVHNQNPAEFSILEEEALPSSPDNRTRLRGQSTGNEKSAKNKEEIEKILSMVKYSNQHPEESKENVLLGIFKEERRKTMLMNESKHAEKFILEPVPAESNPFGEGWEKIKQKIKEKSPFKNFETHTIKAFIAKANDDLKQEVMTMQLIKEFDRVFKKESIPLTLHPYEILITSSSSGLLEFLNDTTSIDGLKKKFQGTTITDLNSFYIHFYKDNYEEAQKNFAQSLAAYSLICYLISIKDRHNGNILLDMRGNIIHIDFGFILGISPGGNMNFENAPFKFNKEYLDILGGEESEMFFYYKSLMTRGFIAVRKYYHLFENIIYSMGIGNLSIMPCFKGRDIEKVMDDFRSRFFLKLKEEEIMPLVDNLVTEAKNNWRTTQYDYFQKLTNGILF